MIIDARHLTPGAERRADVVVIGAGPAGLTCAERLAEQGRRVVLLEAGGRHPTREDKAALVGDSDGAPFPLVRSRHRGFGGSSRRWQPTTGLRVRPYDRLDFLARPGRPVEAWPISADDLRPYYARVHERLGLVDDYTPTRWYDRVDPTPVAWPDGPQLAMFQFAPHDTFTTRYGRVAADPRVDLVLHASVIGLDLDGTSLVRHVAVQASDGRRFRVVAPTVVLAGGGIENARVLLESPGLTGRGVGNEHDNVGRYFMDHLSVDSGLLRLRDPGAFDPGVFGHRTVDGVRFQPMLWLGDDTITAAGLPNAAFWIDERDPLYLSPGVSAMRSLRGTWSNRPGRVARRDVTRLARHGLDVARYARMAAHRRVPPGRRVLAMRILIEQVPDRRSRITLSPRRDAAGRRRVHLHWRIADEDLAAIRAHQDLLAGQLEDHDVGTIVDRFEPRAPSAPVMSNYHHLGSTRMHADPRHGVVDGDGRVHSVPNLFVVGGSTFTSGGYLNPTLTILALALRTADVIGADQRPIAVAATAT